MISTAAFLLLLCHLGNLSHGFVSSSSSRGGRPFAIDPTADPTNARFTSSTRSVASAESAVDTDGAERVLRNEPLAAPVPREFEWWNEDCDSYLDELDGAGGERFVASHDEPDETGKTDTNNWLHVTSSDPERRIQYEIRYVEETRTMGGVVRFGVDCEGPEGCAHGGSIASMADALTATCCFKAAEERWGMTTRLECNYRESIPLDTPVKVEATVTELKKRRASLEWTVRSLTELDRNDDPVRHAFGSADFLLPRLPKK